MELVTTLFKHSLLFGVRKPSVTVSTQYADLTVRAGVHAPIKSVSVPAPISFFPPVKSRSAVHTDRQNRYRRLQGGQFRE